MSYIIAIVTLHIIFYHRSLNTLNRDIKTDHVPLAKISGTVFKSNRVNF